MGSPLSFTPVLRIFSARVGVIMWLLLTITLPSRSLISSQDTLPVILSFRPSMVSLPSMKALTSMPGISGRSSQQSISRMISSCDTSTIRLVRYPESAVRRAVSDRPLRAPCADIKYSSTSRPSRKFDLMGSSMVRPVVSAISPRIPASCLICWLEPRAPESAIMKILLYLSSPASRTSVNSLSVSFHVSTTAR